MLPELTLRIAQTTENQRLWEPWRNLDTGETHRPTQLFFELFFKGKPAALEDINRLMNIQLLVHIEDESPEPATGHFREHPNGVSFYNKYSRKHHALINTRNKKPYSFCYGAKYSSKNRYDVEERLIYKGLSSHQQLQQVLLEAAEEELKESSESSYNADT